MTRGPLPGNEGKQRLVRGPFLVLGGATPSRTFPPVGTEPIVRIACRNCMRPVGWPDMYGKAYRHGRGSESIGLLAERLEIARGISSMRSKRLPLVR